MAAELTTLMPVEGGYYVWVRETLGPFWAVQEAWWTIAYTLVILAAFPVLFVNYLIYLAPGLVDPGGPMSTGSGIPKWSAILIVLASATLVNLRGARSVGRSVLWAAAVVVGAFIVLVGHWIWARSGDSQLLLALRGTLGSDARAQVLLGLSIAVFNFSGWDNASTYAAEVDNPRRNYPLAIATALGIVVLIYLLPVLAGVSITTDTRLWNANSGWPAIAEAIGGSWLGRLIALGGLLSMWGLINAQLLYVSRLPFVLAVDGYLPKRLTITSPRGGAPVNAVVVCSVLAAAFTLIPFEGLAVVQCLFYVAALALEFIALILLRVRRPSAARPFRIPGGGAGLVVVCALPALLGAAVLLATLRDWRSFTGALAISGIIVLAGPALYLGRAARRHATG
jgi:amino acid transporter